jgi:hypothetical protein
MSPLLRRNQELVFSQELQAVFVCLSSSVSVFPRCGFDSRQVALYGRNGCIWHQPAETHPTSNTGRWRFPFGSYITTSSFCCCPLSPRNTGICTSKHCIPSTTPQTQGSGRLWDAGARSRSGLQRPVVDHCRWLLVSSSLTITRAVVFSKQEALVHPYINVGPVWSARPRSF